MEPSTPFRVPASPGAPLFELSPERINQQRLPASPSLPGHLMNADHKHHRSSSDVASKVAFLNSLNHTTSPTRHQAASAHAALQRAILGREEAEAALSSANCHLAEAQIRERKISERLESLMEELQNVKERQLHERQVFEKEVRRARKESFKAGSALVKAQEELREVKSEAKSMKAEIQHERSAKEKSRQEAFERAYALAGVSEEMEEIREKMRNAESERDAVLLEQKARALQGQEEVTTTIRGDQDRGEAVDLLRESARQDTKHSSSEETPISRREKDLHDRDTTAHPRKNRFERLLPVESPVTAPFISWGIDSKALRRGDTEDFHVQPEEDWQDDENATDLEERVLDLEGELRWERKLRERADDLAHFLQMECQFQMCACRIAEKKGERFIHDWDYERKLRAESTERKQKTVCEPETSATPEECTIRGIQHQHQELKVEAADTAEAPEQQHGQSSSGGIGAFHESAPFLRNDQRAVSEEDLFNLSPPKQPPRPSTAIGIMTIESPIRMVPHSPMPSSQILGDALPTTATIFPASTPRSSTTKSPSASPYPLTPVFKTPARPLPRMIHAQTTTTIVPLRGLEDDDVFSPMPGTPGTPISRETALEQIRARRDRARSMSVKTSKSTPGSARRGLGGGLRDISAPGRF